MDYGPAQMNAFLKCLKIKDTICKVNTVYALCKHGFKNLVHKFFEQTV